MRSLVSIDDGEETKSVRDSDIAPLIGQVKIAITAGVEQEFIRCEELAGLEITAAQFVIIRNVLRGSAESACELCHALEVTAAGKAAFPIMEACVDRVVGQMLKGVTKAQIRETQKVLKRMLENV